MAGVRLTPAAAPDADDLIEANLANRGYHAPWAHPFVDRDGFDTWLARTASGVSASFVARDEVSGGIVGVVNLSEIVRGGFQNAYLGFYGMAPLGRRGLMTAAVRQTLQLAFGPLRLHRVEANVQPANARSKALVQRLGFRLEGFSPRYLRIGGEWRDHDRYALLAEEFAP